MNSYEIQDKFKNHVLLRRKDKGDAGALVGKTVVLLFFVNDRDSKWTDSARGKFIKTHESAMQTLLTEAKKFSVSLSIDTVAEEVTVPLSCRSENSKDWVEMIVAKHGSKLFKGCRKHYKETLGYDQLAIAFVFNRHFRAYAHTAPYHNTECSVLDAAASKETIIHELFHQFGAPDLYPLEYFMEDVRKHKYLSIMATRGGILVDSLTAYTIGWSKEIDEKTVELLEMTKHLGIKEIIDFGERS